jgi:hypothetical protein
MSLEQNHIREYAFPDYYIRETGRDKDVHVCMCPHYLMISVRTNIAYRPLHRQLAYHHHVSCGYRPTHIRMD